MYSLRLYVQNEWKCKWLVILHDVINRVLLGVPIVVQLFVESFFLLWTPDGLLSHLQ
jgi:hypothetical protein